MSHTITVRLSRELAQWLADKAARTGISQGSIIREQLERARQLDKPKFMRLAGVMDGAAREASMRKGFSKS